MGERTEYTPGTFSWIDLSTPDQDGAKRFYSALLGWQVEDLPVGEGAVYSMMSLGGQNVAAISSQPEQQRQAGVPPLWQSYVTVESADASAEQAKALGADVHAGPFDVMDAGRMAVVRDPQGAFFMLWEAKRNPGAGLVNAHGALSWNELATTDVEAASAFYGDLFGWQIEKAADEPMPYWTLKNAAGHGNGGIRQPQPGEPANWGVYFGHRDLSAAVTDLERLGASKMMGPMPIGPGEIVVGQDPQGAVFTLYCGDFDD